MNTPTDAPWSAEQVTALAPDAQVSKAGLKLAAPGTWSGPGTDGTLLWGAARGSGKNPYKVCVDLTGPAFTCSCPSRKIPCKHTIGLLHLWSQGQVPSGEPSDYAADWAQARRKRAERKAARAAGPTNPAEAAAAERRRAADAAARAAAREQRVSDGLADLDTWLADQVRQGLAAGASQRPAQLRSFASRMVDAQAPGMARRLEELAQAEGSPTWPETVTAQLGAVRLLVRAWDRRGRLPQDLADTVRHHLGLSVRTEDVLAAPGLEDTWVVTGTRDLVQDRLTTRHVWLYGRSSGRWALLLFFAHGNQGVTTTLHPGTQFTATAHPYPGRGQLRVALSREQPAGPVSGWDPPALGTAAARRRWRDAVAADPWVSACPAVVGGTLARGAGGELALLDEDGTLPLILPPGDGWRLCLQVDSDEVRLGGELSPKGLRPLSVLSQGRVVSCE